VAAEDDDLLKRSVIIRLNRLRQDRACDGEREQQTQQNSFTF
jgi:hypothetical protein